MPSISIYFSLVSRETRGGGSLQSRGARTFGRGWKGVQDGTVSSARRRCPRTWWSIQMKSDHRFLACADQRATCTCGLRCCYQARTCCPMCTEANAVTLAFGKRQGFIANSTGSETRLQSVSPVVGLEGLASLRKCCWGGAQGTLWFWVLLKVKILSSEHT